MRNDFAVLILTHGRAHEQKTYETLKKAGYSGKIYLVCDNLDTQLPEYQKIYGEQVIVFDKEAYRDKTDTFSNRKEMNAVVYARNAAFDIAKKLKLTFFCVCDDDIKSLYVRWIDGKQLMKTKLTDMDHVFTYICTYLEKSKAFALSICEEGAYFGGVKGIVKNGIYPIMSHFIVYGTNNRWNYRSSVYEDAVANIDIKKSGLVGFATTLLSMTVPKTGSNRGGMSDTYKGGNDYYSAFHVIIAHPDCSIVDYRRKIHQRVNWIACTPKILSDRWKK